MTTTTTKTATPAVWCGCLNCYNSGRLVGEWYPLDEAETIDLQSVHASVSNPCPDCEELWIMDHEYLPVSGEMSVCDAQRWAETHSKVGESQWVALCAWVESGAYIEDTYGQPSVSDFEDCYVGEWDSFADYAENYIEETELMSDWPETAQRYFNLNAWARDLAFEYAVMDAPDGGVFVFRSQ